MVRCQRMQIGKAQSTPWRAQTSQPCSAITQVQQGTGQCHQVLNQRTILQALDINGIESDACLLQLTRDGSDMAAATDQNGDGLLVICLQCLLNQRSNIARFLL